VKKIKLLSGMLVLALGALIPFAITAPGAHAAGGACLYWPDSGNHATLNAWNGGPFVNSWHSCAYPNDIFFKNPNGNYVQIEFNGGGVWAGHCIGDAYNDPNNASTSLDACSPAGWGTLFVALTSGYCSSGQIAFKNVHWSAVSGHDTFLGPPNGYGDGSPFYLNKSAYFCFTIANV
jgi:hypothetical protein